DRRMEGPPEDRSQDAIAPPALRTSSSPRRVLDEPSFRIGSRIRSRIRSRIKSRIKDRSGGERNGSSGSYRGATHSELPEGLRQRTSANRPSQRYVREDLRRRQAGPSDDVER